MSATAQFVEIGGAAYEVYADQYFADDHLDADFGAAAWRAASEPEKARALVTAKRVLDRLLWRGTKTDEDGEAAWPRTGISGVDSDEIPLAICQANAELASALIDGTDIVNMTSTGSIEKRVKAGSVEVENFRAIGLAGEEYPLPKGPWKLISPYLQGASSATGARSNGTDGESVADDDYGHTRGI